MISHKHKFIFVEFPKTATTTIGSVLGKYSNVERNYQKDSLYWKHARPSTIKKLFEKENKKDEWKNYFKFTFTRNPWDRLVSLWSFINLTLIGYRNGTLKDIGWINSRIIECKTFKDYIKLTSDWPAGNNSLFRFAFDKDEKFVDFIGKFENLQEDFNTICDKIGISQQQLPHENKTKHKHYTEYYDDETREIVAKKYAKDIEYSGYKFGE